MRNRYYVMPTDLFPSCASLLFQYKTRSKTVAGSPAAVATSRHTVAQKRPCGRNSNGCAAAGTLGGLTRTGAAAELKASAWTLNFEAPRRRPRLLVEPARSEGTNWPKASER